MIECLTAFRDCDTISIVKQISKDIFECLFLKMILKHVLQKEAEYESSNYRSK